MKHAAACNAIVLNTFKMTNELILNYLGDAVIYSSDLTILDCPSSWLNSDIIHFHFLRLQNEPNLIVGCDNADSVDTEQSNIECLFIDPTVVSFIMYQLDETEYDEVTGLTSGWNLNNDEKQNTKRIFVPINDEHKSHTMRYTSGHCAGGAHWSLLVIDVITAKSKPEIYFYSFDSHRGYNISAAKAVATKFYSVLKQHYSFTADDSANIINVVECQAPQQSNGYDCGVFTLGFAEALLRLSRDNFVSNKSILNEKAIDTAFSSYFIDMGGHIHFASNLRKRIGNDIRRLSMEYQKT